jgi:hypothetical protein
MTADNVLVFTPRPYRTPQSTIDAFWYLVQIDDEPRLKAWLAARPLDGPTLLKLWRARKNGEA